MRELSPAQREEVRRDLLALVERLEALLANPAARGEPVAVDEPIGRISRMDAIQQQSMQAANRRADQRRLALARGALQRSASEDFGECQDCGEPVGFSRLKARPETPFCLACQGLREARR